MMISMLQDQSASNSTYKKILIAQGGCLASLPEVVGPVEFLKLH